ncbi:MAG TPA: hypothetical protein VFS62_07645, partial [Chloroflexota bacterium]|nr:hypothetical protein [Chloroflexota bacterium]
APTTPGKQCIRPGDGEVPLAAMLDALPPDIELSVEYWQRPGYDATTWARTAYADTARWLEGYAAARV